LAKNENIGEHSICNFSTNILGGGQGISSENCQNIAKSFAESFNIWNFVKIFVQNFTKTATLAVILSRDYEQ